MLPTCTHFPILPLAPGTITGALALPLSGGDRQTAAADLLTGDDRRAWLAKASDVV